MNSVFGRRAICFIEIKSVGSEVIDEVLQQQHPLGVDVVEGDGRVAAAGCAVLLKTEKHQLPSTILQQHLTSFHFVYSS